MSGTLDWAANDPTPKSFAVTLLDDTLVEGEETVDITLSNPTGGALLGKPPSGTLTLADNDVAPGVCVPGDTVMCLGGGRFEAICRELDFQPGDLLQYSNGHEPV